MRYIRKYVHRVNEKHVYNTIMLQTDFLQGHLKWQLFSSIIHVLLQRKSSFIKIFSVDSFLQAKIILYHKTMTLSMEKPMSY